MSIDDWDMEGRGLLPAEMLERWKDTISDSVAKKEYLAIGFHPWVLAKEPGRLEVFAMLIDYMKQISGISIVTFGECAGICEKVAYESS